MQHFGIRVIRLFVLSLVFLLDMAATGMTAQQTFYLLGDDHQPDPVDSPNQSWMRMERNEVASLEADSTYGWAAPSPESTDQTYSGKWTGRIKLADAPPAGYKIGYAVMSWNPDTNETSIGVSGIITGDGSTSTFDIDLDGVFTVPAGWHLAFGVNNRKADTWNGDASFDIVTAENGGSTLASYLVTPNPSQRFYLLGDYHQPDPVDFPNQAWMRMQKNEVASLGANEEYGWAVPEPESAVQTYSGTWGGRVKFAEAPPSGYKIGYAVASWDPDANDRAVECYKNITGDGTQSVFDIDISCDVTVPSGHHLAFGFSNKSSDTGDGGRSLQIVTAENGGTEKPSFLSLPSGETEDDGTEDDGTEDDGTEDDGTEDDGTDESGESGDDDDSDFGCFIRRLMSAP